MLLSFCSRVLHRRVWRLRRLLCSQTPLPDAGEPGKDARVTNRAKAAMLRMLEEQPEDIFRLVVDCGICKYYNMSEKELKDFARQLNSCYGHSLRSPRPCLLHLTGLEEGGMVEAAIKKHFCGYEAPTLLMKKSHRSCVEEFDRRDLVYLSPSSSSVLQEVRTDEVYVIGGLVDRTVTKWLSDTAARDLRVRTARLPIKEHMVPQGNPHKLDLPIDIVVKILITAHHNGDWDKALFEHFPKRKGWVLRREVAFM